MKDETHLWLSYADENPDVAERKGDRRIIKEIRFVEQFLTSNNMYGFNDDGLLLLGVNHSLNKNIMPHFEQYWSW